MTTIEDRAGYIGERLTHSFMVEGNLVISTPPRDAWTATLDPRDAEAGGTFGWTWPVEVDFEDGPDLVVGFCPEILAEKTAVLCDVDLHGYLDMIEWKVFMDAGLRDEIPDALERHRTLEEMAADCFPGTTELALDVALADALAS